MVSGVASMLSVDYPGFTVGWRLDILRVEVSATSRKLRECPERTVRQCCSEGTIIIHGHGRSCRSQHARLCKRWWLSGVVGGAYTMILPLAAAFSGLSTDASRLSLSISFTASPVVAASASAMRIPRQSLLDSLSRERRPPAPQWTVRWSRRPLSITHSFFHVF